MKEDRFKFRVWDKKEKKMVYFTFLEVSANTIGRANQTFIKLDKDVMQSTGLKDKDGKLIYEGDIIQHCNTIIKVGNIIPLSRLHLQYEIPDEDDWFSWCDIDWETIGNIYENPELLEK